jgi:hypothetical protein
MVDAKVPEKLNRNYSLRGAGVQYFQYEGREALLEGGTRCGKSFAFMLKVRATATEYPGSRQIILRQTGSP